MSNSETCFCWPTAPRCGRSSQATSPPNLTFSGNFQRIASDCTTVTLGHAVKSAQPESRAGLHAVIGEAKRIIRNIDAMKQLLSAKTEEVQA